MTALRAGALIVAEAALLLVLGLLALTLRVPLPLALLLAAFGSGAALAALADRWPSAYVPGGLALAVLWSSVGLLLTLDAALLPRVGLLALLIMGIWRGTRAARPATAGEIQQRLWRGLGVLLLTALFAAFLSTAITRPLLLGTSALLALVFLGAALLALAAPARGQRRQLPAVLLVVGLPLVSSAVLLVLLSASVANTLGFFWINLAQLLLTVLEPIVRALFAALDWIRRLLPFAPPVQAPPPPPENPLGDLQAAPGGAATGSAIAWTIGALAVAVPLLLLLFLLLRRLRRTRVTVTPDEEVRSVFSWQTLAADVAGLFSGRRAAPSTVVHIDGPAGAVRRLYAALLRRAASRGIVREPPETPGELRPRLEPIAGPQTAALTVLTEQFQRARYYPSSVTQADATDAEQAWRDLDGAMSAEPGRG